MAKRAYFTVNDSTVDKKNRFLSVGEPLSNVGCRNRFAFGLLVLLALIIYSNNYQCAWHLDDRPNITQNPNLHIDKFDLHAIKGVFTSRPDAARVYKPIPMLTFALNWYLGGGKIWGFHLVNNLVHFITAYFLFLSVQLLMQTPGSQSGLNVNPYFVALLTAVLWAVHPIQTQTVTYIVQRMAAMAAMFYILGIYFYLKARLTPGSWPRIRFAAFCAMCILFAVLSKESAAMLPVSLILIEIVFFPDALRFIVSNKDKMTFRLVMIGAVGLVVVLVPLFLWHESILKVVLTIYDFRPFTMAERVMTETRVLIFYLSLLFLPTYQRLSLYHHFQVSTSLITPWSTLACTSIILIVVLFAFFRIRKYPLLSFSILFFFLNHTIESSIVGLELVYEHRNYLPSLFFFLPVSAFIFRLFAKYEGQRSPIFWMLIVFMPRVISSIGIGTYTRNHDWKTERSLWEDVLKKYPDTPRALNGLAYGHYFKSGDMDTALALYQRSVSFSWKDDTNVYQKGKTLNDAAVIHFTKVNMAGPLRCGMRS